MDRNRNTLFAMVTLVVVTAVVTFTVTSAVYMSWMKINPNYTISFAPGSVSRNNITKFEKVRDYLKTTFYQDVDEDKMLEGAISGMADSLGDRYTAYFTKEQKQILKERMEGSYVGIGVSVTVDEGGRITFDEVFEDSPAMQAGVLSGDKLVEVDGKKIEPVKTIADERVVVGSIRGKKGTKVKISVYRPSEGKYLDFAITRQEFIKNIKSEMLDNNIGYIRLIEFDSEIGNHFKEHLNTLLDKGMKALILDMRGNPGGDYYQACEIADRLLPEGRIVYMEDKNKRQKAEKSDSKELGLPLAVLVNGDSASASEVVAGAIKDYKKGVLIGTTTYGKGIVQSVIDLEDGSGLNITSARYFTPSGVCIHGKGIQPDIPVEPDEKYKDYAPSRIPRADDKQLSKAIEVLLSKI